MAAELGTRGLLKVASNKGAPGVDGEKRQIGCRACSTVAGRSSSSLDRGCVYPWRHPPSLDTQARGWRKKVGIPNVVDRIVQQAVLQVLEPIFEPSFHNGSHGFAVVAVHRLRSPKLRVTSQKVTAPRSILIFPVQPTEFITNACLAAWPSEPAMDAILKLIHLMLKAKVVLPDGSSSPTQKGPRKAVRFHHSSRTSSLTNSTGN
ncbi:MAG: hypothetical protein KF752_13845 [Pirellulaceae bacterium]|nr:hypothetical protein [Pirellulaceae bacterium]